MLFIGYSSLDRYTVVESIVFHLKNNGLIVWYDFNDMLLSDDRIKVNFEYGIGNSKYVIFIFSENLFNSKCAMEELNFAQSLYEKNEIVFFPILFNIKIEQLPSNCEWVKRIIHNEVSDKTGTLHVANQIIEKILSDIVNLKTCRSLDSLRIKLSQKREKYVSSLIDTIGELDFLNYNAKLGVLYSIFLYYVNQKDVPNEIVYCKKIITRIFSMTRLNISIDHLSLRLFELSVIILLNEFLEH